MNFKKLLLLGCVAGMLFNVPMISAMEEEKTQETDVSFEALFQDLPEGCLTSAREQGYSKYGRLGYTYYKKDNKGHLEVMSTEELDELGVSFTAQHPYVTGNALIATAGITTTELGNAMNYWKRYSGWGVTGLTMAGYTGALWLWDTFKNKGVQTVNDEQPINVAKPIPVLAYLSSDGNKLAFNQSTLHKKEVIKFTQRRDIKADSEIDAFYTSTPENVQENLNTLTDKLSLQRITLDIPEQSRKEEEVDEYANHYDKNLPIPVKKKPVKKEETLFARESDGQVVKSYLTSNAEKIANQSARGLDYKDDLLKVKILVSSENSSRKETKQIQEIKELKSLVEAFYKSGPGNVQKNLDNLTDALGIERIEVQVSQNSQRRINPQNNPIASDLTLSKLFQKKQQANNS